MTISFDRYVKVTSGVGGSPSVAERDLLARIFTTNPLLPTGTIMEFDNADDVGTYFSTASEEYLRAAQYFSWISKSITAADKIAYARWSDVDNAPTIYGKVGTYALGSFTGISDGSLRLTLGATTHDLTGMDFTGAGSLAAAAAVIQAAINAQVGSMWTAATVSYNSTRKSFDFVGGATGNAVIALAPVGSGTDIRPLVGWLTGEILSNGQAAQTITALLSDSTALSNNFGSFCFIPSLTNDQIVEAATWNNTKNNMFQYHVPVSASNAAVLSPLVIGFAGIGLTLDPGISGQYPEMMPMTVLAATKYDLRNAAKNYMYQQFPTITASVSDDADANTYDALRVNYYGVTQQAGQNLSFYQRGYLMGGSTAAQDMGVYANEQWFKDASAVIIMSLLLAVEEVPASTIGEGDVLAQLQSVVDQAIFNGTIELGKVLTSIQKLYITNIAGDPTAWQQIVSLGYWMDAVVTPYVVDAITEYKIDYTIVYAKGDSIRKVEGRDVLI